MAQIRVIRTHDIGLVAARAEVERIARRVRDDFGADYGWDGDTLRFARSGVSGCIIVSEDGIDLIIRLGLLMSPFRGQIEEQILGKIDRAIARYRAEGRGFGG